MIDTSMVGYELHKLGYTFYSGVPCSFLQSLINYAINECEYVAAANEGDAVAIASGAYVGGRKSVVLMQNSGLTNAVSPLVSLNYPFRIPVLGFVSLRGEPGIPDEPQHELMGQITTELLGLMEVEWQYLSGDAEQAKKQLMAADRCISRNRPFFFVVRQGTFIDEPLRKRDSVSITNRTKQCKRSSDELPTRYEALAAIHAAKDIHTVLLATTGKTGRELYEIEDAPNHLYLVGSMGCVSSFGLGLASAKRNKKIIAIDGDGSLLMRMGSMATNAAYGPSNLLHVLLDNNAHDSTGGQRTVSHNVDFIDIAASCGYSSSMYVHDLSELTNLINQWANNPQLTFSMQSI